MTLLKKFSLRVLPVFIFFGLFTFSASAEIIFTFKDVPENEWYYTPVLYGLSNGYIASSDHYRPGDLVLRSEVAKFLSLFAEYPLISGGTEFKDVPEKEWYNDYVKTLVEKGIIKGYLDGQNKPLNLYGPGNSVTRAEVVAMIHRMFPSEVSLPSGSPFTDIDSEHWAYTHVIALTDLGVLQGYADKTFRPNDFIKRSEMAQILYKMWLLEAPVAPEGFKLSEKDFEKLANGKIILGDPEATVAMVTFSDYQCPYCSIFFKNTFQELKEKYIDTGKMKFIHYDFPLSIHSYAKPAANAARCALDQGDLQDYWDYQALLYENQSALDTESLKEYGAQIDGMNEVDLAKCIDEQLFYEEVESDYQLGLEMGVNGTPYSFINAKSIMGAQDFNVFDQVIKAALNPPSLQTPDAQIPDTQTPDTQTPDTQTPSTDLPVKDKLKVSFPGDGITLQAYLSKPEGPGPFPAVAVFHGCSGMMNDSGISSQYVNWDQMLVKAGYVVLTVDSLTPRGLTDVCDTGGKVLAEIDRQEDVQDATAYLDALSYVNEKIGIVGFSHGGSTGLLAVDKTRHTNVDAAMMVYPGCGLYGIHGTYSDVEKSKNGTYLNAIPLRIDIGTEDTTTEPDRCVNLVNQAKVLGASEATGNPIEINLMAGAHHTYAIADENDPVADRQARAATESGALAFLGKYLK